MSGLLEQILEEVRALRGDVESLRNGITGTAVRGLELARGELSEDVVQRIVEQVAARAADEVREQVEAILSTAEPEDLASLVARAIDVLERDPRRALDHRIPLAEGGEHAPDNLRLLCAPCHRRETAALAGRLAIKRREARP